MSHKSSQSFQFAEQSITITTGEIAKQASGSVWVTAGDSVVLVTAQASKSARDGIDFLPLTVDYLEKMSAAGRIPSGFFKREGRLRDFETLTSRVIDRSIRPLFADGWGCESQVVATVFSADPKHPTDSLALTGASAALCLSDIPFAGPIAGLHVCRHDGQWVINPAVAIQEESDIHMFVACSQDAIVMVEGGAKEASEQDIIDALLYAHQQAQPAIEAQKALMAEAGKTKREHTAPTHDEALLGRIREIASDKIKAAYEIDTKHERYAALDVAKKEVVDALLEADESLTERTGEISSIISDLKQQYVRQRIISEKIRIGHRDLTTVRDINTQVGLLPRSHGSALFTRGETQALVSATLGTKQDEQRIDNLLGESSSAFLLHYNFPPYSVGETKFLRGPGRREIGHGTLAHRALKGLIQFSEDFPYTVRLVSDIMESNGSSSMASVCGGSMALMHAGVPMEGACAGIAMGLIKEGEDIAILSDILGDEDHLGDMDFKVAGTNKGITAIQMDIKIAGVDRQVLEAALEQARVGRLHILNEMAKTLDTPNAEMSQHAPRITRIQINVDRIRDIIGPGGKTIKDIVARTGCQIDVSDDGTILVASADVDSSSAALKMIRDLTQEAEIGKLYLGNVRKCMDFGAFVEIFPGTDGLLHISELAEGRVNKVEDVVEEGDEVLVKVIGMERGKIRLSRKQALADEQNQANPANEANPPA